MPTSNLHLAPEVVHLVHEVPHATVLDVGPGWGKYERLLREYLNEKPVRVDAVEAWEPYVDAHGLRARYDHVHVGDVCALPTKVLAPYDVVLMVDVLEHLAVSAGLSLLARIPGRVVICTPVEFFDNGPGLPWTETHRSHWTEREWCAVGMVRPIEVRRQSMGGWLVRLGPLSA